MWFIHAIDVMEKDSVSTLYADMEECLRKILKRQKQRDERCWSVGHLACWVLGPSWVMGFGSESPWVVCPAGLGRLAQILEPVFTVGAGSVTHLGSLDSSVRTSQSQWKIRSSGCLGQDVCLFVECLACIQFACMWPWAIGISESWKCRVKPPILNLNLNGRKVRPHTLGTWLNALLQQQFLGCCFF